MSRYFGFTKREYNGLMVLMTILLTLNGVPYLYEGFYKNSRMASQADRLAVSKLTLVDEHMPGQYQQVRHEIEEKEFAKPVSLFKFDPNLIGLQQWQQLGLSAKQAKSILNYVAKGGRFRQPGELKKMYTISPAKYIELEPYIVIEPVKFTPKFDHHYQRKDKKEPIQIEINAADTLQLDEIKGVGITFARRIVRYRDRLGGFYAREQLLEVFGLDSAKYLEIEPQVNVDATLIKKININVVDFEALKTHPYLTFKQINAIIQFRKQHGNYNNMDDLKKVLILTPKTLQKLAPYLVFQ